MSSPGLCKRAAGKGRHQLPRRRMRRSDRGQVGWDLLVPTPSELVGKAQRKELSDARRRTRDRELRSEMGKERGSDKRSHRLTEEVRVWTAARGESER